MSPLFEELISSQQKKLLETARRIIPHVTDDDLEAGFAVDEAIGEGALEQHP